jgi:UDP-N-acetylmuramoyl-L-alanyl-D-glutamate--2,6-diaminopimelate ligase
MCDKVALSTLISPWIDLKQTRCPDVLVTGLILDSRRIKSGDTFVAIVGHQADGRRFIESAVEQGANLVLAQADHVHSHGYAKQHGTTWVLYLDALNNHLSELAGRLYRHPSRQHHLIGVTGTNGKTTISHLTAQWLTLLGKKAAVMGTTGNGFPPFLQPADNTTGSAIEIQKTLSEFVQKNADYTAMEVSSHGLVQGRVRALHFDIGIFSNLSRDHLDYHGDMSTYGEAKKLLFRTHQCQQVIINADDAVGKAWLLEFENAIGVSLKNAIQDRQSIWATAVQYTEGGITLAFDGSWGKGCISVPLIGAFNASNVLLTLASLLALGIDKQHLIETAPKLRPVIGRMELFHVPHRAKIVVDYAHTPDALEKALSALRVHCQGELWVIFGCGGDRDKGKRPMMANIAQQYADYIVLTDDNPRSENPQRIIRDIQAGLKNPASTWTEHERQKAIELALSRSAPQDIILVAGKGHEDYQVMAEGAIYYSDRDVVRRLLGIRE